MSARNGLRVVGTVATLLLLCGCTAVHEGWDGAMMGIGLYSPPAENSMPAALPDTAQSHETKNASASLSNDWCLQIAKQAQMAAARNGFDPATQSYRYRVSYKQCVEMYGQGSTR